MTFDGWAEKWLAAKPVADKDETTRTAIGDVIAARVSSLSEDPAGALRAKRS